MTNYAVSDKLFTVEEYIAFEEKSEVRHEFHDGYLYPIEATSGVHNEVIQNTVAMMRPVFRKRGCKIYHENVKLQLFEQSKYIYPDIMITCDERDKTAEYIIQSPNFVVEILEESTASYDRTAKFEMYQTIPSVQYYLMIESRWQSINLYSRTEKKNLWTYQSFYDSKDIIEFPKLDFQITFEDIYEGVGLPKKLFFLRNEDE